jgi:hypothetical protein
MKALCKKIWRLLNIDVLFLSLVEKLTRGLSKKLTAFHLAVFTSLNRILEKRNGAQATDETLDEQIAEEIIAVCEDETIIA